MQNDLIPEEQIKSKIYEIRGQKVMLDTDLAELYSVETKAFNQAVKRNKERFPENFMFQLTEKEYENLRSQTVTSRSDDSLRSQIAILEKEKLRSQNATSRSRHGGRRYLPYAFTEQGVSMLSAVLRSKTAIQVSIKIINAFVEMRRFLSQNPGILLKVNDLERKQIEFEFTTNKNFERVFNLIQEKDIKPDKKIFFEGKNFDAYIFVSNLIKSASKEIILIDNFVDETTLTILSKRKKGVKAIILTKNLTKQLMLDLKKHNEQHETIEIKEFKKSHDRFLILDKKEIYHVGASLKDLGKKWFAFSKFKEETLEMLKQII
ncbi:ORF6N domain-containing protein [Candidatus Woesearchaeota archaeon]|nr:ORF6N domain-containing protein [Candidatus Woesearchaeota archaeon]